MRSSIRLQRFATIAVILVVMFTFFINSGFGLDIEKKVYAQTNNSTSTLDNIHTIVVADRSQLAEVKNMTLRQNAILSEINLTSTKLATQGAYTALSVFFLGIALVIFGLRLTARGIGPMGKFFTVMIAALTIPPMFLVAMFQVGAFTHNPVIRFAETEEPFFILSFLMYIPIGIILFLLSQQKKMVHAQAARAAELTEKNLVRELEQISALKDKGSITEEEFQKIKAGLLAKLSN